MLDLFNIDLKDKTIEYLNTELLQNNKFDKVGIVDMLIGVKKNSELEEIILLELQNFDRHNFKERLELYSYSIKAHFCLDIGKNYIDMKKMTVLAIINYDLGYKNIENAVNLITKDNNEYQIFTDKFSYKIFNLSKVKKENLELIKLFKMRSVSEVDIKDEEYKEILKKIKRYNQNRKERERMDYVIELMKREPECYGNAYQDGKKDGLSEGIEQNKKDVAKRLLQNNIDINTIMLASTLTKEQILALK